MKFVQYGAIYLSGTLISNGTEASPVILTSFLDDTAGGDTNGDGAATTPTPEYWSGVFTSGTFQQTFTSIRYT